jgi:alkanesulfonate monooxygenase SsuD/methylene tetrahydromethanopterin reductase-like flavin-dependent oxidoreductase (luciferase family)
MFLDDPFPGWDGAYYRNLPPRDLVPKPIQNPHPPLWVAASKPDTFAEAAQLGLGVIGVVRLGPAQLAPAIRAYQETIPACTPVGGVVNHQIGALAVCGIETDYSVGRDIAGAAARWYFGDNPSPLQAHRFDSQAQLRLSNDQLIEQGIIIGGDADSVCRGIERWKNAGVDTLLLMLGAGNTTHEQVMCGLDILGEKVIPKFK